ncbi:MAG: acetyl-CoA carboxylase, biotin carboxyl carrier protein [Sphingobium sp.]|nr:acetyl-CoA carboxylase, biotin carboxyl carrier protein [Sphingobium sp.]
MSLTAKDVEEIMKLLDASTFDRLSLEVDGMKIKLERSGAAPRARPAPAAPEAPVVPAGAPVSPGKTTRSSTEEGLVEIKAPLLGIFYRAPKPGEPAFVEVGGKVTTETVIGIVEVMKLMNSVHAGVAGEVVEILGQNGELVEHGEALMLVRPER